MSQTALNPAKTPFNTLPTELAYEATLPEMSALLEDGLAQINVDVVASVMTVLGSLPELQELRPAIVRELPHFDVARFDKLEQYALALSHAHALHRNATTPTGSMAAEAEVLTTLRDRLLSAALTLAEFGLIDGTRLKECKTAIGYRPLVTDVFMLVALFKEHWSAIENKIPVTSAMLDDAGKRALELMAAVGLKEQAPVTAGQAALSRLRAFNLFIRAYDDARTATAYLRARQGDAEEIAPSLYTKKNTRSRVEEAPTATPNSGSATTPTAPADADAPNIVIDNRAGFPITPPFTS